jgi:hypothetical protein
VLALLPSLDFISMLFDDFCECPLDLSFGVISGTYRSFSPISNCLGIPKCSSLKVGEVLDLSMLLLSEFFLVAKEYLFRF